MTPKRNTKQYLPFHTAKTPRRWIIFNVFSRTELTIFIVSAYTVIIVITGRSAIRHKRLPPKQILDHIYLTWWQNTLMYFSWFKSVPLSDSFWILLHFQWKFLSLLHISTKFSMRISIIAVHKHENNTAAGLEDGECSIYK